MLRYEDLRDPVGIRFWPGNKGRDGCRTPMPWEAAAPNAGFTSGAPWLPVSDDARACAVDRQGHADSVLNRYRHVLAVRKAHPALVDGSIEFVESSENFLAFVRQSGDQRILCLFNIGLTEDDWTLPEGIAVSGEALFEKRGATINGNVVAVPARGSFVAQLA